VSDSYEAFGPYISQALGVPHEALAQAFAPAVDADFRGILALRRAVIGESLWWDDEAFVRWRYLDPGTSTHSTPYWVFKKDDEIIGACGLEPVMLVVDGEAHAAVRTLDIMVRPDFDGLGLGAFMNIVLFRHFPITMVTGSNARSHRLISRMFHHLLDLRCWKLPVESRELLEYRLGPGRLTRAVAHIVDPLLAIDRWARRKRPPKQLEIRELTQFDANVTALSRQCERRGRVQVRRSADYLNWRFVRNPRCRYRIFGGFVTGQLIGYVVTRFNRARPNPRCEGEIVDWLVHPANNDPCPLPFLFREALGHLVDDGARVISCVGFDESLDGVMSATGFRARDEGQLPFFVRADDTLLQQRLSSAGGWFLTRGDFDVE
jgi:hypothetical protein